MTRIYDIILISSLVILFILGSGAILDSKYAHIDQINQESSQK